MTAIETAIQAYAVSPLRLLNEKKRQLEELALQNVLEELKVTGATVQNSQAEIDGLVLTAHYRTTGLRNTDFVPEPDAETCLAYVNIRAHTPCSICGEMLHSEPLREHEVNDPCPRDTESFYGQMIASHVPYLGPNKVTVTVAAQIGQWLTTPHECQPSNSRVMGFR